MRNLPPIHFLLKKSSTRIEFIRTVISINDDQPFILKQFEDKNESEPLPKDRESSEQLRPSHPNQREVSSDDGERNYYS